MGRKVTFVCLENLLLSCILIIFKGDNFLSDNMLKTKQGRAVIKTAHPCDKNNLLANLQLTRKS